MNDPLLDQPIFRHPKGTEYADRCAALIDYFARRGPTGYFPRIGYIEITARLRQGQPLDTILPALDPLLAEPHGDMFWMYPMVLVQQVGRDRLPPEVLARMRDLWRTYTPYRGDTENHWLLYYASLYLICERYPDDPAATWFNGRSSRENMDEAAEYLDHWIDLTTRRGQGEFDSPHYLPFFLAPLALLYGFAEDPGIRQRAAMMLDYLIADFAVDTLDGLYAGAFSRVYPQPALERWRNGSTSFAWLLFGNVPFSPDAVNVVLPRPGYRPHGTAAILALSGYAPPEIICRIATDRPAPFVHRELKRTRHRIRFSAVRNVPVYKYQYMTPSYAVGSMQGGLLQPIQQHTWEVQWATLDPHEGFNVLFTIHPYAGAHEMGMYFGEEPKLLVEAVVLHEKDTYDKPDKWTGASPFEQVFQHEDTVIALYDIPEGTRFEHISGYFSRTLVDFEDDGFGWIFARGGDVWIAYFPLAPYVWRADPGGDRRLHSPHRRNGAVVQVAPVADYPTRGAFREAILALPLYTTTDPTPTVRFTTLRGATMAVTYGATPRLDDTPVDYENWPLFDGPFLRAARDSRCLNLNHGTLRRTLDFDTLTATDWTDAS